MAKHVQSGAWAGIERIFGNIGWTKNYDFPQFIFLGRVFSNGAPSLALLDNIRF
jgi:hypothetical protein